MKIFCPWCIQNLNKIKVLLSTGWSSQYPFCKTTISRQKQYITVPQDLSTAIAKLYHTAQCTALKTMVVTCCRWRLPHAHNLLLVIGFGVMDSKSAFCSRVFVSNTARKNFQKNLREQKKLLCNQFSVNQPSQLSDDRFQSGRLRVIAKRKQGCQNARKSFCKARKLLIDISINSSLEYNGRVSLILSWTPNLVIPKTFTMVLMLLLVIAQQKRVERGVKPKAS